jgi:ubiquinone/menaquinone biosynthesis C-methylase UbiE
MQKSISIQSAESTLDYSSERVTERLDVPEYLRKTYWWAYLHPRAVWVFERQWLVNLILWGNFARLRDAALDEMGEVISGRTLQVACVYGDFTAKLAGRMAADARLDVVDVAPIQIKNLRGKVSHLANIFPARENSAALSFADASFDRAVVFFLLHEQPEEVRSATVREALRVVKPGGKVIFVDYHQPVWQHPHRYLMQPILKTLEPFALDLWKTDIAEWVADAYRPARIEKTTYFGGLYQKVVMTR